MELFFADYRFIGVRRIWLIDPIRKAAFTFDEAGLHTDDLCHLTVIDTPIELELPEAFAAIEETGGKVL